MSYPLPPPLLDFIRTASANPIIQQLAPLIGLFALPFAVLLARNYVLSAFTRTTIMLATLSSAMPWNWGTSSDTSTAESKRKPRTRAEMLERKEANARVVEETEERAADASAHYTGLVNVSGTYCFMNSTMQALASLSYLRPYLDAVHARAEELDYPSPVTDALRELLQILNEPQPYARAIRPMAIIEALSYTEPGKRSPLFSSREHQDAQELFQLVTEQLKKEATGMEAEQRSDRGFAGVNALPGSANLAPSHDLSRASVFDGLTANRRCCVECGYTEAVMHFSFDSWQLPLPRMAACRLEDCLAEYTKLEVLTDCMCRHCSLVATLDRLREEIERLSEDPKPTNSRKKHIRELKRSANRVESALAEKREEEDIKDLKLTRVFSRASTKQAMVARPPPVLVLHLNRSMSYGAYAQKNSARVHYNEILDLTPFATSGALSTHPVSPISGQPMAASTPSSSSSLAERVLYRLAAVVVHYGTHQFGHYVCFRRLPTSSPPRLARPISETAGRLVFTDELDKDGQAKKDVGPGTGRGWLRISDDAVSRVGIESVLAEGTGAFMLYYERVLPPLATPEPERAATPAAEPASAPTQLISGPSRLVSRASTPARIVRSVSLSGYSHAPHAASESSGSSRSSGSDHGSSSPGSSITSVEEAEEVEGISEVQKSAGKSVEDPEREDTPVPPVDPPEGGTTS
ncbi:cysteine proteinase [Peniophora sp. CONT]|nr:cysteine proteinase [Peniophora sp. CONT]